MAFIIKPDMQVDVPGKERISALSVRGTVLILDGQEHDFAPIWDGGYLPPEAYIGRTPFQEIKVVDGDVFVRYIHQVTVEILDAEPGEVKPFKVTEDGPVEMPFEYYRLGLGTNSEGSGDGEVPGSTEYGQEPSGESLPGGERADSDRIGS
ncbi:structural protein [Pseudomonas phage YH30]|nr:structural protein [Pseudomonas phage YH30]AKC04797.1 structural protein [Pseudomonas phage YH30]